MNFEEFNKLMIQKINEHNNIYGDSWKELSLGKLYDRLFHKMQEFDLTFNKDKLVSIANLAMLLYIRKEEEDKLYIESKENKVEEPQ